MLQPNNHSLSQSLAFFASELFHDVQMSGMFDDSKTFADASPKSSWSTIFNAYQQAKTTSNFVLSKFVYAHFEIPSSVSLRKDESIETVPQYIESLWSKLQRQPDHDSHNSLLALKHPYIVPGGRFREIYYWDSYFTSLGLDNSGRAPLIGSMVDNFIELQNDLGCIPNGNRSYYNTRSQPPILALMIELVLADDSANQTYQYYLDGLLKEHQFWMRGQEQLNQTVSQVKRVVRMPDGSVLNRFWDDSTTPRAESYREDIEAAEAIPSERHPEFFRNIRAACESGWDFSSRWLEDAEDLLSIRTTDIVPIDLNCLIYKLENMIADLYLQLEDTQQSKHFKDQARKRANSINTFLWDQQSSIYCDYIIGQQKFSSVKSLACVLPLFVGLADQDQANSISGWLLQEFLSRGGLITTLSNSKQQWDSPNGWAPLHWFAVVGLKRYQFDQLAQIIMQRWCTTVEVYFQEHGNIMEKYNVTDVHSVATGGEYEVQHGFGWTNGVTLGFYKLLEKSTKSDV